MSESLKGIFIIWASARKQRARIVTELEQHYQITSSTEVLWPREQFRDNCIRFYREELNKKALAEKFGDGGSFTVLVVEDPQPIMEVQCTGRGLAHVNARFVATKRLFRRWTGGGYRVHASNNLAEYERDYALLFGTGPAKNQPLMGAQQWNSVRELFDVLNASLPYLVLRNAHTIALDRWQDPKEDLDLLVASRQDARYILNARPHSKDLRKSRYSVKIAGDSIPCDLHFVGDDYYDSTWETDLLSTRVLGDKDIFIPEQEQHFYALAYHSLLHKPKLKAKRREELESLARKLGLQLPSEHFEEALRAELYRFMMQRGYQITEPADYSVYLNPEHCPRFPISRARRLRHLSGTRGKLKRFGYRIWERLRLRTPAI